ncbi:S41 family peptidase [Chakrabartia godavariana]|nr:S41 family peptidase [Chakrabartia godavariana]
MAKSILRAAFMVSAVSLIPAATAGIAAADMTINRDIERFVSVYERVKGDYVDKVTDEQLIKGAIDGMLASLDPHSSYLDARDFKQMQITTDGNYGGLGLVVSMEDGAVKVVAPQEDSPAAKMGIKSGDYITHLDGKLLYGGTLDEAVDQMRGRPGTTIRLTVVRPGRDKPFDVTVTRQVIEIKPVKWEIKDGVGIININGFSKQTGQMTRAAVVSIEKALGRKPTGYVIDLRSNPGGLLDQAVEVSDVFLNRVEVVSQRGRDKRDIERFFAQPGDFAEGLPIVVLVDAGSASAAEIVAGALQDHHRGLVMGERTFGKGSVQTLIQLDDTTALRLTTARYYTPSGRSVQEGGIEPDIIVPQLSDPDYKNRPRFREIDLGRHLINEAKVDNSVLEADEKPDPRFTATADELKAKGITDFQLDYAVKTVSRLSKTQVASTGSGRKGSR